MPFVRFLSTIMIFLLATPSQANYSIKGKVNMVGEWQSQIFLATVDRLDNYYSARSQDIISVGTIDADGNFTLSGDNLPEEPQFYRLYVIKEEQTEFNACLFAGGEEHNVIHLILDNDTALEINADTSTYAPFGDYTISGDEVNQAMKKLARLVYPSYQFYEMKFPSELEFARDKLNRDLFDFAKATEHSLVSLAAIHNTDFDLYFDTRHEDYVAVVDRLATELPSHQYTKDYARKLRYYGPDEQEESSFYKWLSFLLGSLCIFLFGYIWKQKDRNDTSVDTASSTKKKVILTNQEEKILGLIQQGKSNKEIAAELFVELSTVKTHINKLYSKLGVTSRADAVEKANSSVITGV